MNKLKLLTTIPMLTFVPSLHSSMVSSITMFINGSNPLRIPTTCLPPFSFTGIKNINTMFWMKIFLCSRLGFQAQKIQQLIDKSANKMNSIVFKTSQFG